MSTPGITKSASLTLGKLGSFPWIGQFYLAGGTALALQLQHRLSYDLDFFSTGVFDQKIINEGLKSIKGYKLDRIAANTLLGMIGDTKISLFTYKYKLIGEQVNYNGIKLASIKDIAAMKIDAIGGRGTRRDFVDLYFICQKISLDNCLSLYLKKYPGLSENLFHLIKSLGYFDDAENPPQELKMLKSVSWNKVKAFFDRETIRLANKFL